MPLVLRWRGQRASRASRPSAAAMSARGAGHHSPNVKLYLFMNWIRCYYYNERSSPTLTPTTTTAAATLNIAMTASPERISLWLRLRPVLLQ